MSPTRLELILARPAEKSLDRLPKRDRQRLHEAIQALRDDPEPRGSLRLTQHGEPLWRIRVGDYRVIYSVAYERLIVVVVRVAHRRESYRDLAVLQDMVRRMPTPFADDELDAL